VEVGKISKFGLLEMSRQRLRASLASQSHQKCSHCRGAGWNRATELVALEVLRKIQAAIVTDTISVAKIRLSPAPALYLLNNKKIELAKLEQIHGVKIYILADGRLIPDEYEFELERKKGAALAGPAAVVSAQPAPAPVEDTTEAEEELPEEDSEPALPEEGSPGASDTAAGAARTRMRGPRLRISRRPKDVGGGSTPPAAG
jgi:ribonuclease E